MIARLGGALTLLLAARVAVAAGVAPPLELALAGCEQYDEARLRELVAIEMGTIAARGGGPTPRPVSVRLTCAGERATIEVAGEAGAAPSRSELSLAEAAPATRLRVLALTITELVAQSWAPRAPAAAPPPPSAVAVVAAPPAPPPSRPFALFVETSARRMAQPATWLAGIDVGLQRSLGEVAAAVLDVRAETGEETTSLARVGWRQVTLTGALALGVTRARWAAHALPGWCVGYASLTGRPEAPAQGRSFGGIWSGPSFALRGRRSIGGAGFVALEVAAGFVTRRLVGLVDETSPVFEVRGAWTLVGLGAGLAF